jgi:hypothetical protein
MDKALKHEEGYMKYFMLECFNTETGEQGVCLYAVGPCEKAALDCIKPPYEVNNIYELSEEQYKEGIEVMSTMIPDSEGHKFTTVEGRKELMQKYGKGSWPYDGVNEDGEQVMVSISTDSIVVKTYQRNGWTRVNYYDEEGYPDGETFEGRWNTPKNVTVSEKGTNPQPEVIKVAKSTLEEVITKGRVIDIIQNLKGNCDHRFYDEALTDVQSEVLALEAKEE